MAGAPHRTAAGPADHHERHPGRCQPARREPHRRHRQAHRGDHRRHPPGAAALRVVDAARPRDHRRPGRWRQGAGLHRPPLPEGRPGASPVTHLGETGEHPGAPRDSRRDRRFPVLQGVRVDGAQVHHRRDRRPPCRDAAEVPASGGDPGPAGPAQGDLRHRHPRGGDQCADPHRDVHLPDEVRRVADEGAEIPRVPPDRRSGRQGRIRHRGICRRAGARARGRQCEGSRQGRRGRQEGPPDPEAQGP